MRTIWKFGPLEPGVPSSLDMPEGAVIVGFAEQGRQLFLWADVETTAPKVVRRVAVGGTGWSLEGLWRHLFTVVAHDQLVWHLIEGKP